jgi:hypothetical protein
LTKYELIDPLLSEWAVKNGVHWYTEYQNTDVRTFYINENRRDRVQISVDVPKDQKTVVRIGQNQRGLPRLNRVEKLTSSIAALPSSLDKALQIARHWALE